VSGAKYGGKAFTVYAGSTNTRLQSVRKALSGGYKIYCEIPEYLEDGQIRSASFHGEILSFTTDFITDNDTEYTVEILELPNSSNNYVTVLE
jgi:hypothetical protein